MQDERPHAIQSFDELWPFGNQSREQHFRIAVIPELPLSFQLGAEILVVVDLAVEHQHPTPCWVMQRLVTPRKIDDRQPGLPRIEIAISEAASFDRPEMFEALQRRDHAFPTFRGRQIWVQEKGYPAHWGRFLSWDAMAARNSAS